jgi:biopolymer transport protein ExbB
MDFTESISQIIQKTGIFIYPLLLCSIFGLAVFLQKVWQLRTSNTIPEKFLDLLYNFLHHGELKEATLLCHENNSSISRIAAAAIDARTYDKELLNEKVEQVGQNEAIDLARYIEGLGSVSTISTLLGLLGTIAGMIKIFGVISTEDIINPPALAGGISEALYTTAIGLFIAIPAFIAYKYISGKYEELVSLLEQESKKITELITSNSGSV